MIGDFAFEPRYQGVGSSSVNAISVENVVEKISDTDLMVVGMERGYRRDGKADYNLEAQALELASKAEVILYFLGLGETEESEGLDRKNFEIPQNQISLYRSLQKKSGNRRCTQHGKRCRHRMENRLSGNFAYWIVRRSWSWSCFECTDRES